jgi:hypothetical protein
MLSSTDPSIFRDFGLAKKAAMARVLALSCFCFLVAASAASARSLQQSGNSPATAANTTGVPSLAGAVQAAGVKPNVSLFVDAFDQAGENSAAAQINSRSTAVPADTLRVCFSTHQLSEHNAAAHTSMMAALSVQHRIILCLLLQASSAQ